MQIKVNGELREFNASLSLFSLAQQLELNPKQVAIEHNCQIVPRSQYETVALHDGDQVEIVHFIGGG